jgi:hypothetical protein
MIDDLKLMIGRWAASQRGVGRGLLYGGSIKTVAASFVAPLWGLPYSGPITQGVALGWLVTGLWPSATVLFKML